MKKTIDYYLSSYNFRWETRINFGQVFVLVKSDTYEVIESLNQYFREFVSDDKANDGIVIHIVNKPDYRINYGFIEKKPDPGKTKIKEAYWQSGSYRIVKKVLTGMYFLFEGDKNLAIGPCLKNINQVVNFINNRFIEHELHNGNLLFHSSAVKKNNEGVAISGFSGAGKSTLALHLMNKGWDFVSNDRLLVKNVNGSLIMNGVIKYPRINPGTIINNEELAKILDPEELARYSSISDEELWKLEEKHDGFIDEIYGDNRFFLQTKLTKMVVLNWSRKDIPMQINKVSLNARQDLLPAITKEPGLFFVPKSVNTVFTNDQYLELLKEIDVYEVSGGVGFNKLAACIDTNFQEKVRQ